MSSEQGKNETKVTKQPIEHGELPFCIGYYNRSVILTYISLISAVIGICFAYVTYLTWSVVCLIISGLCDMFDGKIARMCKDRSDKEKDFGVQLDSLADVVAFVVLPVLISLEMGHLDPISIAICVLYVMGGVCRLGYFNVQVAHTNTDKPVPNYTGLPVTSAAIIFPTLWLIFRLLPKCPTLYIYDGVMFLTALCFVSRLKIKKPKGIAYYIFTAIAVVGIGVLLYLQYGR